MSTVMSTVYVSTSSMGILHYGVLVQYSVLAGSTDSTSLSHSSVSWFMPLTVHNLTRRLHRRRSLSESNRRDRQIGRPDHGSTGVVGGEVAARAAAMPPTHMRLRTRRATIGTEMLQDWDDWNGWEQDDWDPDGDQDGDQDWNQD